MSGRHGPSFGRARSISSSFFVSFETVAFQRVPEDEVCGGDDDREAALVREPVDSAVGFRKKAKRILDKQNLPSFNASSFSMTQLESIDAASYSN